MEKLSCGMLMIVNDMEGRAMMSLTHDAFVPSFPSFVERDMCFFLQIDNVRVHYIPEGSSLRRTNRTGLQFLKDIDL